MIIELGIVVFMLGISLMGAVRLRAEHHLEDQRFMDLR